MRSGSIRQSNWRIHPILRLVVVLDLVEEVGVADGPAHDDVGMAADHLPPGARVVAGQVL